MEPLGIRFENFACFDECYVRLDQPLQILVGKNNAGKTAVLRGLTALRGLPIGDTNPIPFVLGGYARGSRGSFSKRCRVVTVQCGIPEIGTPTLRG
jgi:AAA15 family ATPase/GTPase